MSASYISILLKESPLFLRFCNILRKKNYISVIQFTVNTFRVQYMYNACIVFDSFHLACSGMSVK